MHRYQIGITNEILPILFYLFIYLCLCLFVDQLPMWQCHTTYHSPSYFVQHIFILNYLLLDFIHDVVNISLCLSCSTVLFRTTVTHTNTRQRGFVCYPPMCIGSWLWLYQTFSKRIEIVTFSFLVHTNEFTNFQILIAFIIALNVVAEGTFVIFIFIRIVEFRIIFAVSHFNLTRGAKCWWYTYIKYKIKAVDNFRLALWLYLLWIKIHVNLKYRINELKVNKNEINCLPWLAPRFGLLTRAQSHFKIVLNYMFLFDQGEICLRVLIISFHFFFTTKFNMTDHEIIA